MYGHILNSTLRFFDKNILQPSFSPATLIIKIFYVLKKMENQKATV